MGAYDSDCRSGLGVARRAVERRLLGHAARIFSHHPEAPGTAREQNTLGTRVFDRLEFTKDVGS